MTFLKSQQAKAREASSVAIQLGVAYLKTEELDTLIAQTIKDTTAKVRKVLGEERETDAKKLKWCGTYDDFGHKQPCTACQQSESQQNFGHNTLHRKVTQALNELTK